MRCFFHCISILYHVKAVTPFSSQWRVGRLFVCDRVRRMVLRWLYGDGSVVSVWLALRVSVVRSVVAMTRVLMMAFASGGGIAMEWRHAGIMYPPWSACVFVRGGQPEYSSGMVDKDYSLLSHSCLWLSFKCERSAWTRLGIPNNEREKHSRSQYWFQ